MSTKAGLKAAKAAIDSKDWDQAVDHASSVLEKDPHNYFALLFKGRALDQKNDLQEAVKTYQAAAKAKPDDAQALLGLRGVYEKMGGDRVDEYIDLGLRLAEYYANVEDAHRSQTAINKLVDFARAHGTKSQYVRALKTQLPTSPIFSSLEGRLPNPGFVYTRIAEILEDEEGRRIEREINNRKTRLGATLSGVTTDVKREVYGNSELESIYQSIIDWTSDDEVRREYEEKLLERAYDTLLVLPKGKKADKRGQVMKLAHDMVIIKHPYLLAWQIEMEWPQGIAV